MHNFRDLEEDKRGGPKMHKSKRRLRKQRVYETKATKSNEQTCGEKVFS